MNLRSRRKEMSGCGLEKKGERGWGELWQQDVSLIL